MATSKRVFIIHGWDGYPEEGIFPWLKKEMQDRGFEVFNPSMPDPLKPQIETWVQYLKEQIGVPDENTFLFGHSIGAQTILRYIETLPRDIKIGGAVFLAGWVHLTDEAYETDEDPVIAKPWLETPIDWDEIKSHSNKFIGIFSDDDPLVPISDAKIFESKLGAKIIIEHEKEHFSGSTGIKELPATLNALLEIAE
ncbi:MAG: alpha/beta hydrolase [Patescibacteria group bacterium]|nr:alpha/beta hydrolase [Patescibacteria group bacterium]